MGKIWKHLLITVLGAVLVIGVPLYTSDYFLSFFRSDADTVSSASVIIDAPSGDYIVLINQDYHPDADTLEQWKTLFSGKEAGVIFEDISCSVASGDTGALDMAKSLQSRLPENQMTISTEDAGLLFSRADAGCYDILIASAEFADIYNLQSAYRDNVTVIQVGGDSQ